MMKSFLYILSVVLAVACSNSKKSVNSEPQVSEAQNTEDKAQEVQADEGNFFLSFERTQCFGQCPAYRITVYSNGYCVYEGFKWVEDIGKFTSSISQEQLDEISQQAKEYGFYEMKDKYDGNVSDLPSAVIIMATENERKSVTDRLDAPEALKSYEKFLDAMLLNLEWEKQ